MGRARARPGTVEIGEWEAHPRPTSILPVFDRCLQLQVYWQMEEWSGQHIVRRTRWFSCLSFWVNISWIDVLSLADSLATLPASSAVFRIWRTLGFLKFSSHTTFFKKHLSVFLLCFPFLKFKIILKESWLLQGLSNVVINFLICL